MAVAILSTIQQTKLTAINGQLRQQWTTTIGAPIDIPIDRLLIIHTSDAPPDIEVNFPIDR